MRQSGPHDPSCFPVGGGFAAWLELLLQVFKGKPQDLCISQRPSFCNCYIKFFVASAEPAFHDAFSRIIQLLRFCLKFLLCKLLVFWEPKGGRVYWWTASRCYHRD